MPGTPLRVVKSGSEGSFATSGGGDGVDGSPLSTVAQRAGRKRFGFPVGGSRCSRNARGHRHYGLSGATHRFGPWLR
jgi:hypothetical protein